MSALDNGTYKITASSYHTLYPPSNLLDFDANSYWSADSTSSAHRYLGNGAYTGTVSTQVVNVGNVSGEWFQLEYPTAVRLNSYGLKTFSNYLARYPKSFYVLGSNDNSTWNVVDYKTNQIVANYDLVTYTINSNFNYLIYRIVIVSMDNSVNATDINLSSFAMTVSLPSNYAALNPFTTNSTAISLSAWIKTTSTSSTILDLANGSSLDNIKLLTDSTGELNIFVENAGQTNTVKLSNTISDNNWHHIVINIENTESGAIYTSFIDGVQTITVSQQLYPSATLRTLNYLFKSNTIGDAIAQGNMDDVRIYGKILSSFEVHDLYYYANQSVFPLNSDASLLIYEPLDYTNDSSITLNGLTNGNIYSINMRDINYAPSLNVSLMSEDSSGIPYTTPSMPIVNLLSAYKGVDISFTVLDNGGYPISTYLYSLDGGATFIDALTTTSPIQITGLTPGESYQVLLKAVNSAEVNNTSEVSALSNVAIPYEEPNPPTILSITPCDKQLVVKYQPSTYSGGYSISRYEYSLDGATYTSTNEPYLADYVWFNITGSWISNGSQPGAAIFVVNGMKVYACSDGGVIKMSTLSGIQKYYGGSISDFNASNWNSYNEVTTVGAYVVSFIYPLSLIGNPILDTTTKKIGDSSLFLNSANSQHATLNNFAMSSSGFSMAFWVRPAISDLTQKVFLLETTGSYTNTNAISLYLDTDGSLKMTTNPTGTLNTYTLYASNLNTSTWTHIAITINRYKRVKTYINGALATTNICPLTLGIFLHSNIYVGKTGTSSVYYHGHLDDYRIYNGKVLSIHEIELLYNYDDSPNFALNTDSTIIVYNSFNTNTNTFAIAGLTNGTLSNVYLRTKTNAPASNYSTNATGASTPFGAPSSPGLILYAGENYIDVSFSAPATNTSGYNIIKYQYSIEDGILVDIGLNDSTIRVNELILGDKYDVFLHTVSDASLNNISTSTYKNIGTHIPPLAPTITSIDASNTTLTINYAASTNLGGYDLSGYQYSINSGITWINAPLNSFTLTGLTNGTTYTFIMRSITIAPDNNISLESAAVSSIPYTKPTAPSIYNVDSNGTNLDVYYGMPDSGGYSISHYELSVDNGAYINIGTQTPYLVDSTGFAAGTSHTIKIVAYSTAPLNNVSAISSRNAYYVGTGAIPTPVITNSDISANAMDIYYTQAPYGVPIQKYICTEDETTYSEITEIINSGGIFPTPLDVDSALHFYYTFDSDSYSGMRLGNKASGSYVYDASLSTTGIIGTGDKKYGTGSLQLGGGLKWVQLPPFDVGTNGITVSFWFKNNNSSIWSRVVDFSPAMDQYTDTINMFCYNSSFNFGIGNNNIFNPNININDNIWRHFAFTCSTSGYYTFYVNNVIIYQVQGNYTTNRQYNYNFIGKSTVSTDNYAINGGIDEFRLYKRELNVSEIEQLYAYTSTIDTRKTTMQYDLTNPLTVSDLLNGRAYSFKIQSVLDTSNSVAVTNSNFSSGTTSWTMDGSSASVSSVLLSKIRQNNGVDSTNALSVSQSNYGSIVLYQSVNVYGAGKYILKVSAAAGATYDASQSFQIGIDENYSTPFKIINKWKNYIHIVDIPESVSTKQIQLKLLNNSTANTENEPMGMYIETISPFSSTTARSTGIAITSDETRALQSDNNGVIKFATKTNGIWSAFQPILDTTIRAYRGVSVMGNGNRCVVVAGDATANYCYFATWNGTNYSTLTQTLDTTARKYSGCAMSKSGERIVASVLIGYVYFATWNGTNYTEFTQTLDLTSRRYNAITCTPDANRIVYGADTTNAYTFYADWNGTNYNSGTQTLDTTLLNARGYAISSDMKYIYQTVNGNATATLRFAKWNGTNYGAYTISKSLPASLDGWGLFINSANNVLYSAPYGTTVNYKINIPKIAQLNTSSELGTLASNKIPWGIYSAEDYDSTTGLISEMRGYNRSAVVSGTGAVYSTQPGNGTSVAIPQITGTTSTKITFPTGSVPSTFTICAITRLAGSSRNRVLQSTAGNFWFLGHRGGVKACASFDKWMTANGSPTNVENWQVICGKNSGNTPNNILADGVGVGLYTGGTGGHTLCINNSSSGELSDFGFSHVFIWDQALSDSEMQLVSQSLMAYLQSGNSYKSIFSSGSEVGITNVSLSKAFISPISNATDSIIPYSAPLPPTINTVDPSNTTLTVSYSDTTDNGGYSIVKYQYSVNSGTFVDVAVGTNTFTITGLTNGTSYSVVMRSVSSAPSNTISSNSLSKSGTPYARASPLTITSIDASNTVLYVNFSTASTGGYSLVRYEYSLNGGAYTTSAQMTSPLTIAGLTNGTAYTVKIRQITGAPINPDSPDSNTISSIPFKQPLPPTIVSLDPSNQRIVLTYTNSTNNGGYSIDKYQYKINGGIYVDVAVGTNQVYLDGLTNGTSYTIAMRAISTAPFSNISVDSSTLTTIPYTRPSAPIITSIDASSTLLTVNFTEAYNGGYSFVRYEYSLNGGAYVAATETVSPIKLGGLTNGTSYLVKIRQITSAPTINSSPDSNAITDTPYSIPGAPVITTLVPGNRQITVNYTIPASNGRPITNYQYSLNGASFVDISAASPLVITGLINSYSYNIQIYAVNLAGTSLASNQLTSIPFSVPTAPAIVQATPGDRTVTITFTPPADVGGYPILGYKYAFGVGAFTTYTDTIVGYSMTFNNLVNGTSYVLRMKAFNTKGDSPASNAIAFTPNANPATPTITGIVPTMDGAILKYTDGIGSALISGYRYSVNGNSFIDASRNLTGAIVKRLSAGIPYRIKMRAFNPLFDSSDSNIVTIYPGAPDIPTITNIVLSGTTASIYFTQPATDCPAPNVYQVMNNGEGILTVRQTTSPIILSNLKYGGSYNLKLRAINEYNMSYASNGINVDVGGTVPDKIQIVLVDTIQSYAVVRIPYVYNNASVVTTLKYSLNGGTYVDLSGYRPIFKIPNIISNTNYSLVVVATNAYGDSIPSNAVSFSHQYISLPDQPRISNMSIDVSGTLKIFVDMPVSSIVPVDYYKYKLVRDYVEDATWTSVSNANRIITISASTNVRYTARVMAVNSIGSSIASSYWLAPVKYSLSKPSTPNIDGIYNTYDGNLSLFFTIQNTNGAHISDILYSIDDGATYQSSGITQQPLILSGLANNTKFTFRIKAVNSAGTTDASKPYTFVKYYKVPINPYITRLSTFGSTTTVRVLSQDNGGAPITGFKYSIDGGANVSVSLNASKEFNIMNLASGVHTIRLYATNAVGDSLPFTKQFTI